MFGLILSVIVFFLTCILLAVRKRGVTYSPLSLIIMYLWIVFCVVDIYLFFTGRLLLDTNVAIVHFALDITIAVQFVAMLQLPRK